MVLLCLGQSPILLRISLLTQSNPEQPLQLDSDLPKCCNTQGSLLAGNRPSLGVKVQMVELAGIEPASRISQVNMNNSNS